MRLWSIHPSYLDPMGLVALWRESLLAQKVLLGQTRGYRAHPQLARFRAHPDPVRAIGCYLDAVAAEAGRRGYRFDASKIAQPGSCGKLTVQRGQIGYEWEHLLRKLQARAPALYAQHKELASPRSHPLFRIVPGGVEAWERV
ncbi:MAG TPA: pyrimidine dimer DNA glycosylase/endonuclease V [Noviherbaspirillum sp.]|nr:pyrimidine dimer DNA glycosylase/endonuclease V [Noviherbaspirillum sp.]